MMSLHCTPGPRVIVYKKTIVIYPLFILAVVSYAFPGTSSYHADFLLNALLQLTRLSLASLAYEAIISYVSKSADKSAYFGAVNFK